ncbi:MAG: UbiD family decarboxylase [Deltaproteobacteria bacterium]|nr:UbiD family decarboxylase [Deltaproteobacteria bacterium]
MGFEDLRQTVAELRSRGRLLEVAEPVSPAHEVAAVLTEADRRGEGAVYFSHVNGPGVPVVGNVIFGREVLAWAMGVDETDLAGEFARRLSHPIPTRSTEAAPVLERAAPADLSIERILPLLTHCQEDSGPYITTGLVSALSPETGDVARGIHRMGLRGERELGVALVNPPLSQLYARFKAQGRPMPMAVALGVDPLTFASFALRGVPGVDKLAVAGGLHGQPVEVVAAPLTGIPVPARAEFLLEGEVDPQDERPDGPMGEVGGYSLVFPGTPTFRVRRIYHRADPLYHALLPTGREGDLLLAVVSEANIAPRVRSLFPFAQQFFFVPGTCGTSLVVRLAPAPREQIRSLLLQLLTLGVVKKVVAVAEDVDPRDLVHVEWALATRFQPDQDAMILSDLKALPIDPSCPEPFRTAKIALDATGYERVRGRRPATLRPDALERARTLLSGRHTP